MPLPVPVRPANGSPGLTRTPEFRRVLGLPRRVWQDDPNLPRLVDLLSLEMATEAGQRASVRLFPQQAAALRDLHDFRRLVAPLLVGDGKTLIWLLACRLLRILPNRAVCLMPANLIEAKLTLEIPEYRRLWRIVAPQLVSYDRLSRGAECIAQWSPQIIFADECSAIKRTNNPIRYKHLRNYLKAHPDVIYVPMDGTMDDGQTLNNHAHHIKWAVGPEWMPFPNLSKEYRLWDRALSKGDVNNLDLLTELHPQGKSPNDSWGRRFVETPGVVASDQRELAIPLHVKTVVPELDYAVLKPLLQTLRDSKELPGIICATGLEYWRQARALIQGFYDMWDPPAPIEWLHARRAWASICRYVIDTYGEKLDPKAYNEMQVVKALEQGRLDRYEDPDLKGWQTALDDWRGIKPTFEPNSVAMWVSDAMLHWTAKWLAEHPRGVVWTDRRAFGDRLSELTKMPYFTNMGLDSRGNNVQAHKGPMIVSSRACVRGYNLQYHHDTALVVSAYERGKVHEQLYGRHHRVGQTAECVTIELVAGCAEQVEGYLKAVKEAQIIQDRTQTPQKLCYATVDINPKKYGV